MYKYATPGRYMHPESRKRHMHDCTKDTIAKSHQGKKAVWERLSVVWHRQNMIHEGSKGHLPWNPISHTHMDKPAVKLHGVDLKVTLFVREWAREHERKSVFETHHKLITEIRQIRN